MILQPITDPTDPRIADYVNIREADLVKRRGAFLAESREVVRTLVLRGRFRVRSLLLAEKRVGALADVLGALPQEVPVYVASSEVMRAIVGFDIHRGCLAAGERGQEVSWQDLAAVPGPRRLVVLEGLANHDNVGGVFRNAACFGADAVLLDPTCADPLYRKAIRTSMGHALVVPFARGPEATSMVEGLRDLGYETFALTPRDSATTVRALQGDVPERSALVLGTEGHGLSERTLAACARWLRIEMAPGVDSLNVATATGIALWALRDGP